jgi:hypothetical protein
VAGAAHDVRWRAVPVGIADDRRYRSRQADAAAERFGVGTFSLLAPAK